MPKTPAAAVPDPVAGVADIPTGPEWGTWRYTGPSGRVYTNIPLHAEPGDVVTWLGAPGVDWEPTTDAPNVHPDNWRPEPPAYVDNEPPAPAGDES